MTELNMEATPKLKTETVHRFDAFDLDSFIEAAFGHPYEFIAYEESGNDVSHTFLVGGQWSSLSEHDYAEVKEFIETGTIGSWRTGTLLQYAYEKGLLPPGDYIVDVCW